MEDPKIALKAVHTYHVADLCQTIAESLTLSEVEYMVAVLRALKKTPVDNVVGHISLYYELVYPKSRQIALEQGYLMRLADFASENERTRKVFEDMQRQLQEDIDHGSEK